jgi:hypothetical protein
MDSPEAPHQHASHSGHRWFDIAIGVSAMFVSVVTLIVAIEHGRTMQRMADANMRMVEANSWPFIDFSTHNVGDKGTPEVRLVLTNEGIGPARIETFELWWRGKPMSSPRELLKACCTKESAPDYIGVGLASPRILRAGEHVNFLSAFPATGNKVFDVFNSERDYITTRVCYCSVFDECWIKDGGDALLLQGQSKLIHPTPVKACPAPKTPYQVLDVETARGASGGTGR